MRNITSITIGAKFGLWEVVSDRPVPKGKNNFRLAKIPTEVFDGALAEAIERGREPTQKDLLKLVPKKPRRSSGCCSSRTPAPLPVVETQPEAHEPLPARPVPRATAEELREWWRTGRWDLIQRELTRERDWADSLVDRGCWARGAGEGR